MLAFRLLRERPHVSRLPASIQYILVAEFRTPTTRSDELLKLLTARHRNSRLGDDAHAIYRGGARDLERAGFLDHYTGAKQIPHR